MLKPTANGTRASIAAIAVSNTGMILVFPACTTASLVFKPCLSTRLQTRLPICHFYYNTCKPHDAKSGHYTRNSHTCKSKAKQHTYYAEYNFGENNH